MTRFHPLSLFAIVGGLVGCTQDRPDDPVVFDAPPALADWTRDIQRTALTLDLSDWSGEARIVLAPSDSLGASFEIGDLEIRAVSSAEGALNYTAAGGQLDVGVPASADPAVFTVAYTFGSHAGFDGWDEDRGLSFLWPYFCGNLFPCKSDPSDGVIFELTVLGVPGGQTAVFPTAIPGAAPSYMPALAVGDLTEIALGTTGAGTTVSVWHGPGEAALATAGTAHLVAVFDFFESTYGAYTFGPKVGSVSADWGPGAYGGMEHHPYWHVARGALSDEGIHAHEAAHGWFGNGVRLTCWEDFVLSEGTASYLAARALSEVGGPNQWGSYADDLGYYCSQAGFTVAMPDTCDSIDILNDRLWSGVPYEKGACFFEDVADLIGAEALDQALAGFYQEHVGGAAEMEDLVGYVRGRVEPAEAAHIDTLVTEWLTTRACPADWRNRCTQHVPYDPPG